MTRLASFLLGFLLALSLLAGSSYARYSDSKRETYTTYIARGKTHHKRVSKYDYGQGVSFHATVVENSLDDDYSSVYSRSNSLHDTAKFQRGGNYRRRR